MAQLMNLLSSENILAVVLAVFVFKTFIPWIWSRRELYKLSYKLKGPVSYPLVGSIGFLSFLFRHNDFMRAAAENFKEFSSFHRLWLGPQLFLAVIAPEDIECLMSCKVLSEKPEPQFSSWATSLGHGILTSPGKDGLWKAHRRIISPGFSTNVLKSQQAGIQRITEKYMDDFKTLCTGNLVDFSVQIARLSADIIAGAHFGFDSDFIHGLKDDIVHAVDIINLAIYKRMMYFWYRPDITYRTSSIYRGQKKATDDLTNYLRKMFIGKREEFCSQHDFSSSDHSKTLIDIFLNAEKNAEMTENEIVEEIMNIYVAGMDTTAVHIRTAILMLAMHKECQQKAWKEIEDFYTGNKDMPVEIEHLEHFSYLDCFIKEIQRLFPAGYIQMRCPKKSFYLKSRDVIIPEGTNIAMVSFISHRNPDVWENANDFIPERFFPEEVTKRHPFAFYPFAGGPRSCIGQRFGHNMVKTVLVYFLRNFEFQSEWKLNDIPLTYDINVRCGWGYKARVSTR